MDTIFFLMTAVEETSVSSLPEAWRPGLGRQCLCTRHQRKALSAWTDIPSADDWVLVEVWQVVCSWEDRPGFYKEWIAALHQKCASWRTHSQDTWHQIWKQKIPHYKFIAPKIRKKLTENVGKISLHLKFCTTSTSIAANHRRAQLIRRSRSRRPGPSCR